jgi:hypothetical protein
MAEIGYCYGSEFHLMRLLGHHRKELETIITKVTGMEGSFNWLDFPYDKGRLSGDKDFKDVKFLEKFIGDCNGKIDYEEISKSWKELWPQSGNTQNWDAIFKIGDTIFIVEAKARIGELRSPCGAKSAKSIEKIENTMNKTKQYFGVSSDADWLNNYYQFANRLAFLYILNKENNLKTCLLNIYFINGFQVNKWENKENVSSVDEWEKAIDKELDYLGVDESKIKDLVYSVFIDCKGNSDKLNRAND